MVSGEASWMRIESKSVGLRELVILITLRSLIQ